MSRWQLRKQFQRSAHLRDKSYIAYLEIMLDSNGIAYSKDKPSGYESLYKTVNFDSYEEVTDHNVCVISKPNADNMHFQNMGRPTRLIPNILHIAPQLYDPTKIKPIWSCRQRCGI